MIAFIEEHSGIPKKIKSKNTSDEEYNLGKWYAA